MHRHPSRISLASRDMEVGYDNHAQIIPSIECGGALLLNRCYGSAVSVALAYLGFTLKFI